MGSGWCLGEGKWTRNHRLSLSYFDDSKFLALVPTEKNATVLHKG